MLNMTATCAHCPKPVASRGMTCEACLTEAHQPRPKRRAKAIDRVALRAPADMTDAEVRAAVERTPERAESIIPPPIVEPPVYASRPPVEVSGEGRKYDSFGQMFGAKPRIDLVPPGPLLEVGKVLAFGAAKYTKGDDLGDDNWRRVPRGRVRYLAAAGRHFFDYLAGKRVDEESKCLTIAHAITDLMFACSFDLGENDR